MFKIEFYWALFYFFGTSRERVYMIKLIGLTDWHVQGMSQVTKVYQGNPFHFCNEL